MLERGAKVVNPLALDQRVARLDPGRVCLDASIKVLLAYLRPVVYSTLVL